MVTGPEPKPAELRPDAGLLALLGIWIGAFAAGLVTTAVATAGWVRLDYATWPDKDPALGPPVTIAAVGAAAAVAGACIVTLLVRRRGPGRAPRLRRWVGAWAAAQAVAAAGLWGFAHFRDRASHARKTADLVGTWNELGRDGTPRNEVTFRADGTYESIALGGPAHDRVTDRGTYLISADGRHIEFRDHNTLPEAPGPINWMWNIEFSDRDHFRKWSRVWHYTATDDYVRKD